MDGDTVTPRCGQPMQRREASHGAMLDDPVCGRPEGHSLPHRSEQALRKTRELERRTWARRSALRHARLAPVVELAAQAGERSRAA